LAARPAPVAPDLASMIMSSLEIRPARSSGMSGSCAAVGSIGRDGERARIGAVPQSETAAQNPANAATQKIKRRTAAGVCDEARSLDGLAIELS
jgi:hypothetical protein